MVFAVVRYGDDERLIVNPQCVVVNLLDFLRNRSEQLSTTLVDLTDETGLVIDLDVHRAEYADKYVKAHQVYVLVEKHVQAPEDELDGGGGDVTRSSTPSSIVSSATRTRERTKTRYSCLLRKVESLLPDYKLRRANEKKKETVRASSRAGEEETGAPSSGRRGRRPPSFKTVAHLAASRKTKSRNTSAK